ncbi:PREDICTED: clathrin coat assembly protein AP180-like [Ipomoea nil]|uniref:clathrin coat assembly protein AP180-like n=1 Tax=Ipomoea nil TaxID=35883 RepID=UPI000901D52E|nr:PREDICTED: clathrin coat assembly protein AP180-like [Ipomoea nil]
MPSKLKKAIGAVKDQTSIGIAKVASNNSSNLEVAVLKATTHDDLPMEDRYVQEVLQLVSSDKAYAAACARAISKRIGRTRNWIVTLKSLVLVLRIFQDGDPYFPREVLHAMKRGAKILNLSSFRDDSNSSPWDFTAFVRTFALYLDERLDCFLTGKLQRRFTHNAAHLTRRPDEPVREMKPVMLLDRIGHWQRLLERAMATRPTGAAKTDRLVQIALYAVVEESFDLYKDISDGLSLILDNFFHLEHQSGVVAFQTCMRAAKQYEELSEYYDLCKSMGVGRSPEYPSIQKFSEELIETLQEFLKDQSSFPVHAKSPNNHPSFLLLPSPTTPHRTRHNSFDALYDQICASRSSRRGSYGGQSEFSVATDGSSETGSEIGVDDLLSATLTTGKNPAINDLETCSERDDNYMLSESGSAKSLPASNSFADLLSLDDWNGDDEYGDGEEAATPPSSSKAATTNNFAEFELNNDAAAAGWDLVLFETPPQEAAATPPSKFDFESLFDPVSLPLPPANKSLDSSSLDALYNQSQVGQPMSAPPPHRHYNPFLQEEFPTTTAPLDMFSVAPTTFPATPETSSQNQSIAPTFSAPSPPATAGHNTDFSSPPTFHATSTLQNDEFSPAPTFHATPVFSAQSQESSAMHSAYSPAPTFQTPTFPAQSPTSRALHNDFSPAPAPAQSPTFQASLAETATMQMQMQKEMDPLASLIDDQMFSSSNMSTQNMVQEQQLWLQNQNKIIAKHMS